MANRKAAISSRWSKASPAWVATFSAALTPTMRIVAVARMLRKARTASTQESGRSRVAVSSSSGAIRHDGWVRISTAPLTEAVKLPKPTASTSASSRSPQRSGSSPDQRSPCTKNVAPSSGASVPISTRHSALAERRTR